MLSFGNTFQLSDYSFVYSFGRDYSVEWLLRIFFRQRLFHKSQEQASYHGSNKDGECIGQWVANGWQYKDAAVGRP